MKTERTTSSGRFRKGSLALGMAMECALSRVDWDKTVSRLTYFSCSISKPLSQERLYTPSPCAPVIGSL